MTGSKSMTILPSQNHDPHHHGSSLTAITKETRLHIGTPESKHKSYKHLGTWIQLDLRPYKEIRCRLGVGHSTVTALKASIFANKGMPLKTKMLLFDCLVGAALFYNTATWMPLTPKQLASFVKGFLKLVRRVAILHFGIIAREWREQDLLQRLGVAHPSVALRCGRLRFLSHLLHSAGDDIWATIQQFSPWAFQLQDDIAWLQAQRRFPFPYGKLLEDWSSWSIYILENPVRWKAVVRKALTHSLRQQSMRANWDSWHRAVIHSLIVDGGFPRPTVSPDFGQEHYCVRCKAAFSTKAGWAVHSFRKHGRTTNARQVACEQTCGACLQWYSSHCALINHLTYSTSCLAVLLKRGACMPLQSSINSRDELHNRKILKDPHMRAQGPLCVAPIVDSPSDIFNTQEWHLLHELRLLIEQHPKMGEVETGELLIKNKLSQSILHQDEMERVLLYWWQHELVTDSLWHRSVPLILGKLCAVYFFDNGDVELKEGSTRLDFIDVWLLNLPTWNCVPRPLKYRPLLIGHLFSGHRRPQDLQAALEQLEWPRGHTATILSIDIIFSEEFGNLLNPDVYHFFHQCIVLQMLVVLYAGPPCETWSRARLRGEFDGGPKAVRHEHELAGLQQLSLKELGQVDIGNALLGVAVRLAVLLCTHGGMFTLEHPTTPPEVLAPSIWKIPILRLLGQMKQVQVIELFAGHFGARSLKPTTLMVFNGPPNAREILMSFRSTPSAPLTTSIGRTCEGEWQTAVLKEYPARLCAALAQLAVAHVELRSSEACLLPLPADALERLQDLIVHLDFEANRGSDYHPVQP